MKKTVPPASERKSYNKKELFFGIVFLIAAFACVFIIFYLVVRTNRRQFEENTALEDRLEVLNIERVAVEEQARELKAKIGTTVSLERLLDEAKKTQGSQEASRREGVLWIDRSSQVLYVTLGALQGLTAGDQLKIFEGDREVGVVRVETPMDVISYVRPINKTVEDFDRDYYRAVIP